MKVIKLSKIDDRKKLNAAVASNIAILGHVISKKK